MENHGQVPSKEREFSRNLEELKAGEAQAAIDIERALKRKQGIIDQAREETLKSIEDSGEEIAAAKEKRIAKGIKEIEKDVAVIIDKARKDAEKLGKAAEPEKAAAKLATAFFSK
ncbi:MAG TPA: hypothetical protein VJI13_04935 [Candidatus Norongarragalinales archaeon]|nr:hypothetical protein [Candidatus Norongarragalinales archaeon]